MQAHPTGLAECDDMKKGMLAISNGEVKPAQLKVAFDFTCVCNDTQFKTFFWATSKAQTITTILAHWRRLKYEHGRRQCCLAKATQSETRAIHRLIALEPRMRRSEDALPIAKVRKNRRHRPKEC